MICNRRWCPICFDKHEKGGFKGVNAETIEQIIRTTGFKVTGINEPSFDPECDDGKIL